MNEGLIPRRYAKALYKVAAERGDNESLYALMNKLLDMSLAEPSIVSAVANPFVPVEDKFNLLKTAVGEDSQNGLFADFLKLLDRNKRLDMIFAIACQYVKLYRDENNIYKVDVTSASEMSDEDKSRLKAFIERNLAGGKMEFSSNIDPGLIGGFTVTIDNRKLDASVSNELKQLRVNLLNQ